MEANKNVLDKAVKYDEGKTEYHLLPSLALEEVAHAYSYGAKKYEAYNWAKGEGINWSKYFSAALRHLWAYWRKSDSDIESKRLHLAHAGCCILILIEMQILKIGIDDRPNYYK